MSLPDNQNMDADVILVGGGLTNCLIAYWLAHERPDILIAIIEPGRQICADHFWPFRESSLNRSDFRRLQPFISKRWREHDYIFAQKPEAMICHEGLSCLSGELIRNVLHENTKIEILLNTPVISISPQQIELPGQIYLTAELVIDGSDFQKDQGVVNSYMHRHICDVQFVEPHGLEAPLMMDCSLNQSAGLRYMRVFPMSPSELTIQLFNVEADDLMSEEAVIALLMNYVENRGWRVQSHSQPVSNCEPFITQMRAQRFWRAASRSALPSGDRAAFFHHMTFDSLVMGVRLAGLIADLDDLSAESAREELELFYVDFYQNQDFFHSLNELISNSPNTFTGPSIYRHIHNLPELLVQRFYAGKLWSSDKMRISMAIPDISLTKTLGDMRVIKKLNKNWA